MNSFNCVGKDSIFIHFMSSKYMVHFKIYREYFEQLTYNMAGSRFECAAVYGARFKRCMTQELIESLAEFELWFERFIPEELVPLFVDNMLSKNLYFRRKRNNNWLPVALIASKLDEFPVGEVISGNDCATFESTLMALVQP